MLVVSRATPLNLALETSSIVDACSRVSPALKIVQSQLLSLYMHSESHVQYVANMSWPGSIAAPVIILLSILHSGSLQSCEVSVMTPWESVTHIPRDSSVIMSCTAGRGRVPKWYITLPGDNTQPLQFFYKEVIARLNSRNFYEMPTIEHDIGETIQLLINSTEGKNGTKIDCVDIGPSMTINETSIIIDEPISMNLMLEANDVDLQVVNISWSPVHFHKSYTLTVTSINTQPQLHESLGSYFLFTAPEGAPPCEVYNFSIAAAYVGTTYTGPGCHVVLSRMLPSLPNKEGLESSFNYSIEWEGVNAISITVSLKDSTSHYCEDYPITNYTFVVENSLDSSERWSLFMTPTERFISTNNLSENTMYVFRMFASNAFGSISTDNKEIYTTDIQLVNVELRNLSAFRVRCDFMTGSIAQGCVVVLVGEFDSITVKLSREANNIIEEVINTPYPTSCYNEVIAFDIESDGSVGSLPVLGKILPDTTSNSVVQCLRRQNASSPKMQQFVLIIVILLITLTVISISCIIICLVIVIVCKLKNRSQFKTTVKSKSLDKLPPVVAPPGYSVPLYELPTNLSPDTKSTDKSANELDDDYCVLRQHNIEESVPYSQDNDCPAYAMLQEEHFYHILENGKTQQKPRVVLSTCNDNYDTPDSTSDKPPAEEFPIYQEVSELSIKNPLAVS